MEALLTCGDRSFGPQVASSNCRSGFDFTLLFEETFLSIAPSVLLLLIVPLRVIQLYRSKIKVHSAPLYVLKLVNIGVYLSLQVTLLVLWSSNSFPRTQASLAAAVLNLLVAMGLLILSHFEHQRTIRPSFLLNSYLLLSLIFDSARTRTLWLLGSRIAPVYVASDVCKCILSVFEAYEKRRWLLSAYRHVSPETTSGLFGRSMFWWLNPLLLEGFGKILVLDDLFPISQSLSSSIVFEKIQASWKNAKEDHRGALMIATLYAYRWTLLATILPRVFIIAFKLSQPFLVQRAVKFVSEPITVSSTNVGYGLIGAYTVVYIGVAVSTGFHQHLVFRLMTMIRGGLIALIYQKMLEMEPGSIDEAAAQVLMSTDVERLSESLVSVIDLWANLTQTGIAIFILAKELGLASIVPVAISLITSFISFKMGKPITARQKLWLEAIQKRIKVTSDMLDSMKGVKISGLTEIQSNIIQDLRMDEVQISLRYRTLNVLNVALMNCPLDVIPVITFTVFVLASHATVDVAKAFTSLSMLIVLSYPMVYVISAIPQTFTSFGYFERIREYLNRPSRKDHRLLLSNSNVYRSPTNENTLSVHSTDIELRENFTSEAFIQENELNSGNFLVSKDCSFGWSEDKAPILKNISIHVPKAKLTIIVGPVGSGKSTMLQALLGETSTSQGFIHTSSLDAAFCSQTPWIINDTIRNNILGVLDFEETWYWQVINACALIPDFQQLNDGDHSLVGSKGITLSGGQKQRVSIARALYARKQFAIFDDVLSGLDAVTEEVVFNRVFGNQGLLSQLRTTVILVTHAVHRLPSADHIIVLSQSGEVSGQGSYPELHSAPGYIAGLALQNNSSSQRNSEESEDSSHIRTISLRNSRSEAINQELSRRTGDFRTYTFYARSLGIPGLCIFLLLVTANATFGAIQTLWLNWWSSSNVDHPGQRLGYWLGIYGLIAFLNALALTLALLAPMSFFSATDNGVLINHFSQDMRLIDMTLPMAVVNASFQFISTISTGIMTSIATKYIAITFPFIVAVLYLVQRFYLRTSRQLRLLDLEAKAPLYTHFSESLSGLITIRAFNWGSASRLKNLALLDASQKPAYLLLCIQRWLNLVLDLIVAAIAILIMAMAVKLRGVISPGYLGIALVNIMTMGNMLTSVISFWTLLETSLGAIARVKRFVDKTPCENDDDVDVIEGGLENWPQNGEIVIQNICASYSPTSSPVLKNLSMTIPAGQRLGICGRTGSGKSSLTLALFRMLDLSSGSINIDNIPLACIPRQLLRRKITAVSQDTFFLPGTVRLNADPFRTNTDKDIEAALRRVQLWDIISLKGGLAASMDENFLSAGQRQLFCMARAVLRRSRVVVLDEPTSSVDHATDAIMQRILREEFSGCTLIMIAHRLSSILDFDCVAVMELGEVVECAPPRELLCWESKFKRLVDAQSY